MREFSFTVEKMDPTPYLKDKQGPEEDDEDNDEDRINTTNRGIVK